MPECEVPKSSPYGQPRAGNSPMKERYADLATAEALGMRECSGKSAEAKGGNGDWERCDSTLRAGSGAGNCGLEHARQAFPPPFPVLLPLLTSQARNQVR
jgi:hypothetical protein